MLNFFVKLVMEDQMFIVVFDMFTMEERQNIIT